MTIDEETGRDVVCPICNSPEYWECGHLVASLDRSFLDCYGGALFDRYGEVSSRIEEAFVRRISENRDPVFKNQDLDHIWKYARERFQPEDEDVEIEGYALQRLIVTLLEDAGAHDLPGSLMDPGGPGMTSSMSVLFAHEPNKVVRKTFYRLARLLKNDELETHPMDYGA
ncbi:hypothetical protein ACQ5SP_03780 [Rhodovulum sp. YNF3179]|uniref:hypothetical protein n=1 Tax=Rhodovulum sp. YNF3179 TaxID=3425127 RepID=UPI003D337348